MERWTACLMGMLLAVSSTFAAEAAPAEGKVSVESLDGGYHVTAATYTARLDKTGSVQSLRIGGIEFIAPKTTFSFRGEVVWPGTACGRNQGGGWPLKLVPLLRIKTQDGNRVRAEGDQWWIEYTFLPSAIEFTVGGVIEGVPFDGYPKVFFCWSLSPKLARACDPALQGELGWPLLRSFNTGKLAVLDANGAGLVGLPECGLSFRSAHTTTWPLWMTFPAEHHTGRPQTYRLNVFDRADLAHSLKLEIVSPNPDHFFIGDSTATFPVRVEALYGHSFSGRLTFRGKPFVWEQPEVSAEAPCELSQSKSADTITLKIATPKPGQYTGLVSVMDGNAALVSKRIGFITSPERIPPAPVPADFDEFWDKTLAELGKVPLDMEAERVPDMSNEKGDVFKVKYRSWGGRWAWAWLHVPKADGKVPGQIVCPPVSVYQPGPARPFCGQLRIWAAIHGGDIADRKPQTDFDYMNTGIASRDDYMLRYSYSCLVRCYDIMKAHPKCDGTISVTGGSQGGGLAMVLAGLRPCDAVTGHAIALCRIDWTILGHTRWGPRLPEGQDPNRIAGIVSYYDPARFTHRIKGGKLRFAFGLFDWCAPAEGILSALNALPESVGYKVCADPFGDHFHSDFSRLWADADLVEVPRWQGTDEDNKVAR